MSKERLSRPTIHTFKEAQDIEFQFSRTLMPNETPASIFTHLEDELEELGEAIATGTREEVGNEIADLILFAIKIASCYNIPIEDAISAKINRNWHKYNPHEVRVLVEGGKNHKEARLALKDQWDKDRDKDFK